MTARFTRREMVQVAGSLTVGGVAGGLVGSQLAASTRPTGPRERALRVAHLTDVHVFNDRRADKGLAACLRHVHDLKDQPDLILNGGDSVFDAFEAPERYAREQGDLWKKILAEECRLPIEHCIGNHDIWGWNRRMSRTTGTELLHGKNWAKELFGLEERYRSFDRAGWHFIVLDSTFPDGEAYKARLDEGQFEWLQGDLQSVPRQTPVLVLSHIPILCACSFFDGENEKTGNWLVPGAWMHIDARRFKTLFSQHPNVKLCLSGHIHLRDRVDYNGVSYLCNGAVCAKWWQGPNDECEEGYGLIDLYTDGNFDHQYVSYGWKAGPKV